MILLDTHIWFWWVASPELLTKKQRSVLEGSNGENGVSIISLWEVSVLESKGRLVLPKPVRDWFTMALEESGIEVIDLDREIAIEANHLPGSFHRDPADRIIVATSRVLNIPLMTSDEKISQYPDVAKAG